MESFIQDPGFDSEPTFKQSYAPQSGEIFGILEQMKETFESNLSASQKKEAESQKAYEHLKAAKEEEMPRSAPREATGVATRVRLAQQHGTSQSGSHSAVGNRMMMRFQGPML